TNPADNATGVTVASVLNELVFELTEPATANGGTFINVFRDASPVESIEANDPNVDIIGTTVTVTLASALSKGSSYTVSIDAGAFSDGSANNSALDATWNWDMEAAGTPSIIGTFPADLQTEVPINTNIQFFFDQDISYQNDPSTDGGGGVDARLTIISAGDANFGAGGRDYTVNANSTDAGFSPSYIDGNTNIQDTIVFDFNTASTNGLFTELLPNTTYTVEVGAKTFEDKSTFNDVPPIATTFSFTFTTVVDGTPPTLLGDGIVSFEPDDQPGFTNTVNSTTTTQLDIIFNEDVAEGTGSIQLFLDTDNDGISDATVFDIAATDAAVSFVPENLSTDKLRIDLSTLGISLSGGVSYFVNVDSDAVLDDSGNAFAGFNDATTWNFTTLTEAVAPSLLTLSPDDNSTNVGIGANFVLTFDEAVSLGTTEEVRLFLSSNDELIETITASALSVNNDEVTIDFVGDLSGFTDYYITIESGVILDLSANPFAGFSDKNTWNFKTEAGTDNDAPVVTFIDPADGASNVATLPDFSITFNEPVFQGTGNFYVRDGGIIETFDVATDVAISGNIVTFSSSVVLTNNTTYTLDWDAGVVTDSEGNDLDIVANQTFIGGTTWDFTTIADTDAPVIVGLTPDNDETGVTSDAAFSLVIDFDEAVDLGTGNLEIFYNDGLTLAPSQSFAVSGFVLSNSDQTATLTVGPLDGATEYYVSLPASAFVDEAVPANNVVGINPNGSWSFTTVADGSLPTITNLNPINTASNVDLNGSLVLTFSERVFAGLGDFTITSASQTITIDVADGTQISGFGTNEITINPNVELFNGELYTVSVDAAAVTDASGNNFDPATLTYGFTSETATEVTAGTVELCEDGPSVTLSDIIIDETSVDNFTIGNNQTVILDLPTDFEFDFSSANISLPAGDITATSIAASTVNTLVITYSVGSIVNTDQITVSGLAVIYTGQDALTNVNVTRSGTGTADLEGNQSLQSQPHIVLNTNLAPAAPLIEDPAAVGTFITELAVESLAGSTFDLQVNSAVGSSTYSWENVESNNAFIGDAVNQTDLENDADYVLTTDYLYSFDVTETDINGCVSPATRFNIFNYDLTLTPNVTAFSEDDDTGTVITISKPVDHSASFSGTALGGVNIPADGVAGSAEATFVPSTAGSTGSPYQITYTVNNLNTGESFDFTDGLSFTVSSLVTIFTNTVPTEYCFTAADINNNIDLDISITPPNFYFYRIALFDNTGTEVVGAIEPENPTTWEISGLVTRVIGPGFPPPTGFVAGNHFTRNNWILNPSLVPAAGEYEIRYFIIRDGVLQADIPANEIEFRTQAIEIFGLPTVDITNLTNTVDFFCEDDGLVTIEATVNSSTVTVDGYSIVGTVGSAVGAGTANIVGEQIDLADPLGDGADYASSTFRIDYTSDAADDINGCINTVSRDIRILAKPDAPALTSGTDLGTEILFEFCVGESIPDFQISTPAGNPTD
ncbi:MAG: Ig-like domain-containing protein, partial [Bacteroidota bacterium]